MFTNISVKSTFKVKKRPLKITLATISQSVDYKVRIQKVLN